jgi:glutamate synthase domain-containing protein 3
VRSLKSLIQRHLKFTGSQVARQILLNWDKERVKFVKVGGNLQHTTPPLITGMHVLP